MLEISYKRQGFTKDEKIISGHFQGQKVHYNLKFDYHEPLNFDAMVVNIKASSCSSVGILDFCETIALEPLSSAELNIVLDSTSIYLDGWSNKRIQTNDSRFNKIPPQMPAISYNTNVYMQPLDEDFGSFDTDLSEIGLIMSEIELNLGCGLNFQSRKFNGKTHSKARIEVSQ